MTTTAAPVAKAPAGAETTETTEKLREEAVRPVGWQPLLRWTRGLPRLLPSSLRTRIAAWFIAVFALSMGASVFVIYEALLIRLDERIGQDINQEVAELRALVRTNDPATGEPLVESSIERIFTVYLQRQVPSENEALITFVDSEPFLRSPQVVPYRLDTDPELVARWAGLTTSDRGRADTPAGRVEFVAVPLSGRQDSRGVFVAAVFRDREKGEVNDAVQAAAAFGLAVLLLGSILAWRLAERISKPVTELTRTARLSPMTARRR